MLSKVVFAQNFTMLAEVYDKPLTKTLQSTYYYLLKEMSDDDFKQAIKRLLSERTFASMPKPAEILELTSVVKVVVKEVNENELKANELILLVKAMNDSIYQEHIKTGVRFDDLLQAASFPKVSSEDIAVLNKIRPYYELKSLIAGINQYQTSSDTLNAFKDALKSKSADLEMIQNIKSKLRIKR